MNRNASNAFKSHILHLKSIGYRPRTGKPRHTNKPLMGIRKREVGTRTSLNAYIEETNVVKEVKNTFQEG